MKQECPTYLKNIRKSKVLATTLSDTEPEDDSNNDDERILNAFTATMNPIEGIVEEVDGEEDLVESKFEKISLSLKRWMNKITSIKPKQNCTRSLKSMRNCIGWSPRSLVMWNLNEKKSPQSLMKLIMSLEPCSLRTISWLRGPRSLKRSCFKSELSWRGL